MATNLQGPSVLAGSAVLFQDPMGQYGHELSARFNARDEGSPGRSHCARAQFVAVLNNIFQVLANVDAI